MTETRFENLEKCVPERRDFVTFAKGDDSW